MSASPDPAVITAEQVRSPWPVEIVASTGSTNADLLAAAAAGAADRVLIAEEQTAGRGRLDRTWVSPPGSGITMSVLVRPAVRDASLPLVPLVAGIAVASALDVDVKWPNDVMQDSRKLGGILVQSNTGPGGVAAVIGIGLNTSLTAEQLPVPEATSLALAGRPHDRVAVINAVLASLGEVLGEWETWGDTWLVARYREVCTTIGATVRVSLPGDQTLEGVATGVDNTGALLVEGPQGLQRISVGDIVHLRTVGKD